MKILHLIIIACMLIACSHKSSQQTKIQEFQPKDSIPPIIKEEEPQQDEPYTFVEQMPSFPGGEAELYRFIRENLKYPSIPEDQKLSTRTAIRFTIDKNGDIKNIVPTKEIYKGLVLTDSLTSVIKRMPRWIPGKQNGKEVDVYFTLPLHISPQRE